MAKRLGEILIEEGMITEAVLQEALAKQKSQGGLLGRLLVQEGYVSQEDVVAALVKQCRIPHLSLSQLDIDPEVISLMPPELVRSKHVLPIDKLGNILTVAMVDPMDFDTIDQLRELTGLKIKPIVCTYDDLDQAVLKYLGEHAEDDLDLPEEEEIEQEDLYPPDPQRTFDELQITPENEMVVAAARSASESVEVSCSPLLLRGPMGSGKSHLLHAIGNRLKEIRPSCSVSCVDGERLVPEFEQASFEGTLDVLEERLSEQECLLIDDVDILMETPESAQVILNIVNSFTTAGKQLILTTALSASELNEAAPGLGEQLAGGASLDLPAPSLDIALDITRNRASEEGMAVDDDIILLALQESGNNPKWALDALRKVTRYSQVIEQEPTISLAGEVFRTLKKTEEGMNPPDTDNGKEAASTPPSTEQPSDETTMKDAKALVSKVRIELKDALEGGAKGAAKPLLLEVRTAYKKLDQLFKAQDLQAIPKAANEVRKAVEEALADVAKRTKAMELVEPLEKGIVALREAGSQWVGDCVSKLAEIKTRLAEGEMAAPALQELEELKARMEKERKVIESEGEQLEEDRKELLAELDQLKALASDLSIDMEGDQFYKVSGAIDSGDIEFATHLIEELRSSLQSAHKEEATALRSKARNVVDQVKGSAMASRFESEIQEVESLLATVSQEESDLDLEPLKRAAEAAEAMQQSFADRQEEVQALMPAVEDLNQRLQSLEEGPSSAQAGLKAIQLDSIREHLENGNLEQARELIEQLGQEVETLETSTASSDQDQEDWKEALQEKIDAVSTEIAQLSEYSLNDEEYTQVEHMKVSLEDLVDTDKEELEKAERRLQDLSAMASDLKEVIEERISEGGHKEAEEALETAKEAILDAISEGADVGSLQDKLDQLEDLVEQGKTREAQAVAQTILMASRQAIEAQKDSAPSQFEATMMQRREATSVPRQDPELAAAMKRLKTYRETVSDIVDQAMDQELSDEASDAIRKALALIEQGDQASSAEELEAVMAKLDEQIQVARTLGTSESPAAQETAQTGEPQTEPKRSAELLVPGGELPKPDPKFLFDNFLVGKESEFTCTAARSLALSPGEVYNPFFVFGMPGAGKTHLLHAVGNAGLDINPEALVCCISWSQLTNWIASALMEGRIEAFCEGFEQIRFLLIDDLQFGDEDNVEDQEWLTHILQLVREQGNQVFLTGRHAPKRLPHLSQELLQYLEEGIVTALSPLSLVDKTESLKQLCDEREVKIPETVLERLAAVLSNEPSTFEPSLDRFVSYLKSKGKVKEEDLTEEAIREILEEEDE